MEYSIIVLTCACSARATASPLLQRAQLRLRGGDLGVGNKVPGLDLVDLLLRDQPFLLARDLTDPREGEMSDIARILGAPNLVTRRSHIGFSCLNGRVCPGEVILHFRDFEGCQHCAFRHAIADVDTDLADIARDLGHDVDFLVRLEFGRQFDVVREFCACRFHDRHDGCVSAVLTTSGCNRLHENRRIATPASTRNFVKYLIGIAPVV